MRMGDYIKKLRLQKGLTQEELAEKTNLTARTIQRIENGEVDPRAYTLQTIAAALDVSYEELSNCGEPAAATENDNLWLALLHLSGIFLMVFPPLLVWLLKSGQIKEIRKHGIDVINFQLSMLMIILPFSLLALLIITIPPIVILGLFSTVIIIINTIKVLNHEPYKYPMSLQIIKG